MLMSPSRRVLFVHVQKTGGVSVEALMRETVDDIVVDPHIRHAPLDKILERFPEVADYWTFGFVRNPWARMLSWWAMVQHAQANSQKGGWAYRPMAENPFWQAVSKYEDFDTFLRVGPKKHPRLARPQIRYLTTTTKRADFIGRNETFADDMRTVLEHLGLPAPAELPHKNKGHHVDYRQSYTPWGRDRVAEVFAEDLTEFGYEF
jgi:sulfotransferase famil protein